MPTVPEVPRGSALQALAAKPQQPLAAGTANASTIAVHRVARGRIIRPVPSSPIGFGDVAAHADRFKVSMWVETQDPSRNAAYPFTTGR